MSRRRSVMKVASRRGSFESNRNAPVVLNEREKLISLVQAWRQKYEQLLVTSQSYFDELEKHKADLRDLKMAKEIETNGLQEKMLKDRKQLEEKITKLQTVADIAKTKADLIRKNLQQKIDTLETETQPLINGFKLREEKLNKKLDQTQHQVEYMQNEINLLHIKLAQNADNHLQNVSKLEAENQRLKASYLRKMTAVRMHCVRRIAEARRKSNPNLEDATKGSSNMEIASAQKDKHNQIILLKTSYNMERKELQGKLESVKRIAEEEKSKIVNEMKTQTRELKKRVELGRLKIHNRDRIKQELQEYIKDVNRKLHQVRKTNMDDVIRRRNNNTLIELSRHLGSLLREFGAIQRAIKMVEGKQRNNPEDDKWTFESLRLELMHASKVAEINRTKQMIRLKQLNLAYQPFYTGVSPRRRTSFLDQGDDSSIHFLRSGYTTPESSQNSLGSTTSSNDTNKYDSLYHHKEETFSSGSSYVTAYSGSAGECTEEISSTFMSQEIEKEEEESLHGNTFKTFESLAEISDIDDDSVQKVRNRTTPLEIVHEEEEAKEDGDEPLLISTTDLSLIESAMGHTQSTISSNEEGHNRNGSIDIALVTSTANPVSLGNLRRSPLPTIFNKTSRNVNNAPRNILRADSVPGKIFKYCNIEVLPPISKRPITK